MIRAIFTLGFQIHENVVKVKEHQIYISNIAWELASILKKAAIEAVPDVSPAIHAIYHDLDGHHGDSDCQC